MKASNRAVLLGVTGLVAAAMLPWSGAVAHGDASGPVQQRSPVSTTFSNSGAVTINDEAPASPYPSTIKVSHVQGPITNVRVKLLGYGHTCPHDVEVLLVGPFGQQSVLMADLGPGLGCPDSSGANLTFDDSAAGTVPYPPTTGTYAPTDGEPTDDDTFPAPAPSGSSHPVSLSEFDGTVANGTWSLYVLDTAGGDTGAISDGWRLKITTNDKRRPDTTITKARIRKIARTAKFTFTSTEPRSTFSCKLDAKAAKACPGTVKYRHLKLGKHTFKVFAIDRAGNRDKTPAVRHFRIPARGRG
jgi:subtilisin-like proprotein convertase family protein